VEPDAAARLLSVTAGMLAMWTTRFGFPRPMLVDGDQPSYSRRDLIALRDALATGLSIPSAIAHAQDALRGSRERF
jgi:hypothetical protein